MKLIYSTVATLVVAVLLISCQKEADLQGSGGGNTQREITGNYNFVGITSNQSASVVAGTGAAQEKIVTKAAFTATNNVGTINITSTTFATNMVGYRATGTAVTEFYLGGVLVNSLDNPFDEEYPPSSGNSTYRKINNDSIFFETGLDGDPTPIGARIRWSGDTLLMTMKINDTYTEDLGGGVMAQVTEEYSQVIKMKKL